MSDEAPLPSDVRPERPGPDFAAAFDAAGRPLLLIAADPPRYTMVAANKAHARAFATKPEALVGRGVIEVFGNDLPPEIERFVRAIEASFARVIATKRPDDMGVRAILLPAANGEVNERFLSAVNSPILGPDGSVTHIVSATQDVTGEVLERRSEAARALLMREVDHRARNTLAVVQSFVRLATAETIEEFRDVLEGRVAALARAQTSLAARRWEGASLQELLESALSPLAQPDRLKIGGPVVILPAEHVQPMSMIIHELATNARKYGALSSTEGYLAVDWALAAKRTLVLTWSEVSGAGVAEPLRRGFGSFLMTQLARQLGGEIRHEWLVTGLKTELRAPLTPRSSEAETPDG